MNETNNEEIELNGVTYVRKDSVAQAKPTNTEGMPYVICRGHECGVHAGFLKDHDGNHATLVKSRRLWYWKAKEWVERFPELREQANATTHFGCNMMLVKPQKYKEMMEEEFAYIDEIMKTPNLQRSIVSYFCETIITPYIIRKHNRNICVGRVLTHL